MSCRPTPRAPAHQLAALAPVATMGGVARGIWNNGGEIGVLGNDGVQLLDWIGVEVAEIRA